MQHLSVASSGLTHAEMKIANLIKDGKSTEEIADRMNLSPSSADFHRNSIRSNLGLKNKRESLKIRLLGLSREAEGKQGKSPSFPFSKEGRLDRILCKGGSGRIFPITNFACG